MVTIVDNSALYAEMGKSRVIVAHLEKDMHALMTPVALLTQKNVTMAQ